MPITQTRIVRIVVEGAVQGVGYRVFVSREAGRLQLDGWVRNRRDGSVETLVAGPSAVVEQFLIAARRDQEPRPLRLIVSRKQMRPPCARAAASTASSWRARIEAASPSASGDFHNAIHTKRTCGRGCNRLLCL